MYTIKKGIQCLSGFPPTQSWPDLLLSAPFRSGVQSTILHGESCVFLSSRTFINGHPFWFSRYSVHSSAPRLTSLQLSPCHNCKGHWIASRPTSKVSSGYPFFLVVSREKLCLGCISLAVRMFHLITTCLSKKVLKKRKNRRKENERRNEQKNELGKMIFAWKSRTMTEFNYYIWQNVLVGIFQSSQSLSTICLHLLGKLWMNFIRSCTTGNLKCSSLKKGLAVYIPCSEKLIQTWKWKENLPPETIHWKMIGYVVLNSFIKRKKLQN